MTLNNLLKQFEDSVHICAILCTPRHYSNTLVCVLCENYAALFSCSAADEDGLRLLHSYIGHPSFDRTLRTLRNQLLAMPRRLLAHTTLSEKNW